MLPSASKKWNSCDIISPSWEKVLEQIFMKKGRRIHLPCECNFWNKGSYKEINWICKCFNFFCRVVVVVLCVSSLRCHGLICGLKVWHFLGILTCFLRKKNSKANLSNDNWNALVPLVDKTISLSENSQPGPAMQVNSSVSAFLYAVERRFTKNYHLRTKKILKT